MISGYAQFVIGPAGSGKTTYCHVMQQHALLRKRKLYLINLDPASESTDDYDVDIKELISIDDVMSTMDYGPNGGLIFCLEYLLQNLNWLHDQIQDFGEGSYFLIDCPGQIELYSHLTIMKTISEEIKSWGLFLCAVYCLDITFLNDSNKYIAGSLVSLSSMIQLELPYTNILTKCDKLNNKEAVDELLEANHMEILEADSTKFDAKFFALNKAIAKLLQDYANFQLIPLNIKDEDSLDKVLYTTDMMMQYGEQEEPQDNLYNEIEEHEDDDKPEPAI